MNEITDRDIELFKNPLKETISEFIARQSAAPFLVFEVTRKEIGRGRRRTLVDQEKLIDRYRVEQDAAAVVEGLDELPHPTNVRYIYRKVNY